MPSLPEPMPAVLISHGGPLRVLAFDTSTEWLAAALHAPSGAYTVLAEGGAAASATLLPHLAALLSRAGLVYADIDTIAFGRGPGAFTGLRTACAVAQGLGLGLARPLLAIDSLLIVAEDARVQAGGHDEPFDIGVVMDARMSEAYAGRYRWQQGRWQVLDAPALYTLPALGAAWAGVTLDALAGSALAAFDGRLALPSAARRWPLEHDRAAALLRLALLAAAAGEGIDAAAALPLYLRDKVALTTQEREAAKAVAQAPT